MYLALDISTAPDFVSCPKNPLVCHPGADAIAALWPILVYVRQHVELWLPKFDLTLTWLLDLGRLAPLLLPPPLLVLPPPPLLVSPPPKDSVGCPLGLVIRDMSKSSRNVLIKVNQKTLLSDMLLSECTLFNQKKMVKCGASETDLNQIKSTSHS
jgi:hypothetical protein